MSKSKRRRSAILGLQAAIVLGLAIISLPFVREGAAGASLSYWYSAVVVSLVWMVLTAVASLGPTTIVYLSFLVPAFLFNAGRAFAWIVAADAIPPLAPELGDREEALALLAALIVLHGLHLGALAFAARPKGLTFARVLGSPAYNGPGTLVGLSMIALGGVPAALVIWNASQVASSAGYMGLYEGPAVTGYSAIVDRLSQFFAPGCIFVIASAKRKAVMQSMAVCLIAVYSFSLLNLGFRGWAVLPMLAAAIAWHYSVSPLRPSVVLAVASIVLFVVFPLIPVVREASGPDRYSAASFREAYDKVDSPAVSILLSMGSTARTTAFTQKLVPDFESHRLGSSYVLSLFRVIPNFLGGLHPAASEATLAEWVTWHAYPEIASRGGGIGYSFVAEAYLNFGWIGLVWVGLMVGMLLGWMGQVAALGSLPLASVATFLSHFIFWVRGDANAWMRPLFWYSIGPVVVALVVGACFRARGSTRKLIRHEAECNVGRVS